VLLLTACLLTSSRAQGKSGKILVVAKFRLVIGAILTQSELVAKFEIARLHDKPLRPQDVVELKKAEKLAKMFLEWDIDPDTQDVQDVLKNMIEVCLGDEDEDEESVGAEIGDTRSIQVM